MNDMLLNFAASLILLPGPILPSIDDVVSLVSPPAVEQQVPAPAPLPSIESLLATPNGYRAPGYEALIIAPTKSNAGN